MSPSYNIIIKRFALLLLPPILRRERIISLLCAAVAPLSELMATFTQFRRDVDRRLRYNGQVCHLRGTLNDMFDPGLRRIRVSDTPLSSGLTLVPEREIGEPLPAPARERGMAISVGRRGFVIGGYDFVVTVPPGVDKTRVAAVTNQLKLASKRFQIIQL